MNEDGPAPWPAGAGDLSDWVTRGAEADPEALAHALVGASGDPERRLTRLALRRRAWGVARALRERLPAGERVLLLFSCPLEFLAGFVGCLDAGLIAVPAPPPEPSRLKRALPRLGAIVEDCGAALVLADTTIAGLVTGGSAADGVLGTLPVIDVADCPESETPPEGRVRPDDVAYLQYTSGSTASPRGIMVRRAALADNLRYNHALWRYGPDSLAVNWMPYYHDYGLVEGLLQPLHAGIPALLLSPTAFLRAPGRWLRAISAHGATHAAAPNFGYAHCVARVSEAEMADLDLTPWRVASTGAEMVRPATLERFAARFAPAGFDARAFMPSYGLAEATLLVTAARTEAAAPAETLPSDLAMTVDRSALASGEARPVAEPGAGLRLACCGRPGPGTEVRIVDPDSGAVCSDGRVGEIWVRGGGLGAGYWGRPEDSARTFDARPAGAPTDGPGYLRTGDLGFMVDGGLYVSGRRKELIVVHGVNHVPHDIEATARAAVPALAEADCAAFAVEGDGAEQVALAVEAGRDVPDDALPGMREAIAAALWETHQLTPAHLVVLGRGGLPKTSSGKVQRTHCRTLLEGGGFEKVRRIFTGGAEAAPAEDSAIGAETADAQLVTHRTGEDRNMAAHDSSASADELITALRAYAAERINPTIMDERRALPPNVVLDFGALGLLGLRVPRALHGKELTCVDFARVLEQIGGIDVSLGVFTILQNGLGLPPLLGHGTPEQRAALVPTLAEGRALVSFAYTEQGAGSNVRAIEAEARPDAEGTLRLTGTKFWSGSSAWASTILVFAREVDAAGRPLGISAFITRRGMPGLRTSDEALTMGLRATIQNRVELDRVPVGAADRLGAPGQGLQIAQEAMSFTRLCLAALCLGTLRRVTRVMHRFASRRTVITGPLERHPTIQARLSHWTAAATALDALVAETARRVDRDGDANPHLYAACKALAPELLWGAADDAMQLLGGRGYMEHNLIAMVFRDARAIRIFEGPTESINHHLGAAVLNDRAGLDRLLRHDLDAPDAADRLAAAADAVEGMDAADVPWSDAGALRARRAQGLGDVAAWSLMTACLEGGGAADGDRPRALTWCRAMLDEARRRAATSTPGEAAVLDSGELAGLVGGYAARIGDGSFASAGVETGVEPELAPGDAAAPAPAAPVTPAAPAGGGAADDLEQWMVAWLARTLGLTAGTVAPDRPFATYGLDSVTASMLAMDLEGHLGRSVDATAIWDYPSPRALAAHLAAPAGPGAAADGTADTDAESAGAAAELDALLREFGHD